MKKTAAKSLDELLKYTHYSSELLDTDLRNIKVF